MIKDLREVFFEILQAVLPVIFLITILQFTLINMPIITFLQFLVGALMVIIGLILFLYGLKISLLPLGEAIGAQLPNWGSVILVLIIAFILGFAITLAEPNVRFLAHQVDIVSEGYISKSLLIAVVALGVGIFVALAMLRVILGIPIAYLLLGSYLIIIVFSFFTPADFVAISFDAGGVTTGPMTVPFILALGIGLSSVLGGKSNIADSFGLIGLASIGPVLAVMILGVIFT